ncbi:MAG TPA: L-threonylcarbamoyladenylate synthase, partial [Rhabdochlamydiaceae bacterium]
VSARLDTIAVRQPSHPIAQELIRLVGDPLVAPSANLSGKPSSTSAQHVLEDFSGKIAAVIEGGSAQIGIESTVLSLVEEPTLLRLGKITQEELEAVLGRKIFKASAHTPVASPGMKYRHYAPLAKVLLFPTLEALYAFKDPAKKQWVLEAPTSQNFYGELRRADLEGCQEVLVLLDPSTSSSLKDRMIRSSS